MGECMDVWMRASNVRRRMDGWIAFIEIGEMQDLIDKSSN